MRYKVFLALLMISAVSLFSLTACGVPKAEHEKIVKELQQVNQEKTKLTEQLDTVRKEKESAAQQVAQLRSQIDTLQKENESLKAKASPKKPAAKAPVKAPVKK